MNGEKVAEGRIERTLPGIFSAHEAADIGIDLATPAVDNIGGGHASKFTGRIPRVTLKTW